LLFDGQEDQDREHSEFLADTAAGSGTSEPQTWPGDSPINDHPPATIAQVETPWPDSAPRVASGEKAKARDLLAAIRILNQLDEERRPATRAERQVLGRFAGFGPVALSLFPDPITGQYKDAGWQSLGEELKSLLSDEDYDSAKRTTFNAFYTSPTVIAAVRAALDRLGVPDDGLVLEPGCGSGNFIGQVGGAKRFIGVELDRTSGRIAQALYPQHDIRIENFRDTRLPEGGLDAVIGNVPFADLKLSHNGERFSLHDYFFAKSVDALKPGGVLALVTSHFTLDKQNAALREYLGQRADFLGAIRLPSDAFKREGTAVVTDIVFLRKRASDEPARHADPAWLQTRPLDIEGLAIGINGYFHDHPEMVLGSWSRQDTLYKEGFSVTGQGDLAEKLRAAIERLPKLEAPAADLGPQKPPREAFHPPPPLPHLNEGSFFVREDRAICQAVAGESVPVSHGSTLLKANGTLMGRRLAALVNLRDHARRVLESQNDGWPQTDRIEARRALNEAYDRFVSAYGPINKTTFGETKDGAVIRRLPNLVKFREDPDAMLVMSLEEYDEVTGQATKAAILHQDVVGKTAPVTHVTSAEEGLLVSLDRRGAVDLALIASLYGKPEQPIIEELGDLIYRDPESQTFQTADAYLSGNVRAKLAAAEVAGPDFLRNAEALRAVQPPDVLPGDIDANLGAPWIPAADIQAFAAQLFGVAPDSLKVAHLKKDALWSVEAGYAAERSVAATADFGTPRANGTWLFELALNMKTPVIYDTLRVDDREVRAVNQQETLAAREKQKLIKENFSAWVFDDPDRTERLVRIYNDTYNNLRPRRFDGSHLEFPGMNRTISLRPHQQDAIWRGMASGNTLLAHAVGAGKTYTMAATGMKLKAAGLIKKPMYVVPNHMLEQFARDFLQLYPNAKLLVASKEDLARDRRKLLTAKIASGAWDGIIVTHSSFERIGMSRGYQERFLAAQIAEYERLLCDGASRDATRAHRNLIKIIEKQKAQREERLKDLLAENKKDDGLVFDELGVDHLFIDEAHYFKNLETPTKMERVAGIQTGGSQRAFDLSMKARYLDEQHAGHGVTFATGTPISNTMVEMYTMQRFLDPKGLAERGIEHFDAWAATFGEVVDTMEISPDGASLRPRSRFARFTNLPELQQMFRAFSDVQTAQMLDLPRPRLAGDKPQIVACPMSAEQAELQQKLVARYERLRSERVDPREDNALAITTDGRKLALEGRLLSPDARDHPDTKVNALVERVVQTWQQTHERRGTQVIFCDLGVRPTAWGYSVYEEVLGKLIERGIPRQQIAAIGEADSDAKKQSLFEKVRNGSIRVLIGSTQKMGVGTNVQKRLVALHHLDAPWKPAEVEQREGRILRQGNENQEVAIYRYVTEGSFDAYMWQALETKARFISQVMTGEAAVRRTEDVGGQELSYAEVKAIASGNPAVLTLAEADAELQRLAILKKNHADEQFLARRRVRELPATIEQLAKRGEALQADLATLTQQADAPLILGGRQCWRDEVPATLGKRLDSLPERVAATTRIPLGEFRGLGFGVTLHANFSPEVYLEGATVRQTTLSREHRGPRAVWNALERLAGSYGTALAETRRDLALAEGQLRDYQSRLGKPFVHDSYSSQLAKLRNALKEGLARPATENQDNSQATIAHIAAEIKQLKAAHTIEAAPRRSADRPASTAEVPVTSRVRRRIGADFSNPQVSLTPNAAEALPVPFTATINQSANASPAESSGTNFDSRSEPRQAGFRKRLAHDQRSKHRQTSLF
jgi:N12 class adenine-specific DNA methylase